MDFIQKTSLHPRPKKTAVGIYLGPESIEIVYLKKASKGVSILKTVYREIPRKDVTGNVIKEILKAEGIRDKSVTTTIPEELVVLRRFTMPIIPPKERPSAIRFEAKRHIPFNIDDVISDYHIVKEDCIKKEMEILFIAAKKEDIHYIMSLLEDAELTVESIEPQSIALIKTLNITGELEEKCPPTLILHFITNSKAQIVIVENGIPYLKREITLVNREKKLEEQLLSEITLSTGYYRREFPEKNITKLIVCGLRTSPVWIISIVNSLGIPVEQALPLKDIAGVNLPNPQLEIPIGLAASRVESPKITFDLLPKESPSIKHPVQKIIGIETTIALCVLGLVYLSHTSPILKIKKEIATAEAKKVTAPNLVLSDKSMDELNTLKTDLQQKKNILTACTRNRILWGEKLKRLALLIPKETWLTRLTIGDSIGIPGSRLLILTGSTYTPDPTKEIELTNNFSKALKEDPVFMKGFKRLTLGSINKTMIEGNEVANFDISLTTD